MKLIDILNLIARGELEEGTKIGLHGHEWEFRRNEKEGNYDLYRDCPLFEEYHLSAIEDEVEIIGHDTNVATKIEELIDWHSPENDLRNNGVLTGMLWNKLNEVIRELNRRSE